MEERDLCVDCGVNTIEGNEYFMVTDALWKRAGMRRHGGFLCIGCLETRIGRQLTSRDFTECPLNWRNIMLPGYGSDRLVSRMINGGPRSKWRKGMLDALSHALATGSMEKIRNKTLLGPDVLPDSVHSSAKTKKGKR